jgi:tetratricopeptide (TPR) repeat protein
MSDASGNFATDPGGIDSIYDLIGKSRFEDAFVILKGMPDAAVIEAGVIDLAVKFRDGNFMPGALYLARMLTAHFAGETIEYLQAAEIYVRAEDFLAARETIGAALTFPTAAGLINDLVKFALQSRDHDICGAVVEFLVDEPSIDLKRKINIGLAMADECFRFNARGASVRCLRRLWELADESGDLDRIAAALVRIGEYSMALGIRQKLLLRDPENTVLRLDILALQIKTSPDSARATLAELLVHPQDTPAFWDRISDCRFMLGDTTGAIEATARALECGADELACRRRMTAIYIHKRDFFGARAELKKLLAVPEIPMRLMPRIADLAAEAGDREAAMDCAMRQYAGREGDAEALLNLIHTLVLLNEFAAAAKLMSEVCEGTSRVTQMGPNEWVWMATEAGKIGRGDLELRLTQLGIAKHPKYPELVALLKESQTRHRLLGFQPIKPTARPPEQASLLGRLWRSAFARG